MMFDRKFKAFCKDERGSYTVATLITFMTMIMLSGIVVDVARIEAAKTRHQLAFDSAALAAASLMTLETTDEHGATVTLTPEQVVNLYLEKANVSDQIRSSYLVNTLSNTETLRSVEVRGPTTIPTYFMQFLGSNTLTTPTISAASQGDELPIEVSLLIDFSGSMGTSPVKLSAALDGAVGFVEQALQLNEGESEPLVSISLLPYSSSVNIGHDFTEALYAAHGEELPAKWSPADLMNPVLRQSGKDYLAGIDKGICANISVRFFANTRIPNPAMPGGGFDIDLLWGKKREDITNSSTNPMVNPIDRYCDAREELAMLPVSNDEDLLIDRINAIQPDNNTSIADAVKWGVSLLDPSARRVLRRLNDPSSSQYVKPKLRRRPFDYGKSRKFLIVMTDGVNSPQMRIKPQYARSVVTPSGYYYDVHTDEIIDKNMPENAINVASIEEDQARLAMEQAEADYNTAVDVFEDLDARYKAELNPTTKADLKILRDLAEVVMNEAFDAWKDAEEEHELKKAILLGLVNRFAQLSIADLLQVESLSGLQSKYGINANGIYREQFLSGEEKDIRMVRQCKRAREQGITIWSIVYEAGTDAFETMQDCAGRGNVHEASVTTIESIFQSLVDGLRPLRLTI